MFAAAEKLEVAIRHADAVEPELLEEFTLVLGRQVQAIRQAMREVTPNQPADEERGKSFDARTAFAAIARLRALLESSDGDAADAFLAVQNILKGTLERSQLDVLSRAISEFDFDAALLKLDEIAVIMRVPTSPECRRALFAAIDE